jgi:hypothetical protein
MPIINSIISWVIKQRIHQVGLFMKYPVEMQEDWMRKLLSIAKNTEYGKRFQFDSIKTAEEFRDRIPLIDYEGLKPYVQRLMEGEENLLWPGEVKWFAKSSGTTNDKSKFIPVSEDTIQECHYKGGKDLLSFYCNNHPETLLFNGKSLALGGTNKNNGFSTNTFYGDISAILLQNLPFWFEFSRVPELSIALMEDWEEKIELLATKTMYEDVTNISGVPTWTLILAKKILEKTGKNNLLDVWPNLELYVHGAVSFVPYREQFNKLIPSSKMNYVETYNASEGFFGIQDEKERDDMLLMLDYGIYYEFIPLEEVEKEFPRVYHIGEVELGITYALVISTNSGLFRYKIGDTIKFTSFYPHRIKISGRTKHFINAFGEELMIDNADRAVEAACRISNATVKEYTAAPVYFSGNENAAHEWLIEFEKKPDDLALFADTLDKTLKELNSDYEAKRHKDIALRPPIVRILPENTFYNWMKSKNKLGGQNKVPRLSNERNYVNEIIKFSNISTESIHR